MNFKTKDDIVRFLQENEKAQDFDLNHESHMIMYRFLSEVERVMEETNINKKQLAEKIGTSSSYITQLFRGNKLLNLPTVAKFQAALDIKFKVSAIRNDLTTELDVEIMNHIRALHTIDSTGFWVSVCGDKYEGQNYVEDIELSQSKDQDRSVLKIA